MSIPYQGVDWDLEGAFVGRWRKHPNEKVSIVRAPQLVSGADPLWNLECPKCGTVNFNHSSISARDKAGVQQKITEAILRGEREEELGFPRFRGHLNWRDNVPGGNHDKAKASEVHG